MSFLRFGVFALLAVELHVGCDQLDDLCFRALNALDAALDAGLVWALEHVCAGWGASRATTDSLIYRAVELIDLELKMDGARVLAALFGLCADALLVVPLFSRRLVFPGWSSLRDTLRGTWVDPTVLRVVGPLATGLATVAGAFSVSRAMEVQAHALLIRTGLDAPYAAGGAALLGLFVLIAVLVRLAARATVGAVIHAEVRAIRDLGTRSRAARRSRGLSSALVALPPAILALSATPVLGTLRALLRL